MKPRSWEGEVRRGKADGVGRMREKDCGVDMAKISCTYNENRVN